MLINRLINYKRKKNAVGPTLKKSGFTRAASA